MNPTPRLTPEFVAKSLGVYLTSLLSPDSDPTLNEPFTEISTDTRRLKPGALFVAIRGEKLDGHEYIQQALEKGARGVICEEGTPHPKFHTLKVFQVKDTLASFRKLAHDWRSEFKIPVIAVCGSVGKTTTKELLTSILRGKFDHVLKTEGSQNGFLGIPITLMGLRPETEAAVIEVGIDEPGAMKQHMELVRPTHAIVTALGPEHLEKLIDLETVAREEALSLVMTAQMEGQIAWNLDEPGLLPHLKPVAKTGITAYTLGPAPKSQGFPVLHGKIEARNGGHVLAISTNGAGGLNGSLPLPLPGEHHARNLLGAATLASQVGLTLSQIQKGLTEFQGASGRTEIYDLTSPVPATFLCDYYNANPTSVEAALKVLAELAATTTSHRKIACLGDMLELGQGERTMHEALAKTLSAISTSHVLLYGPRMKWLQDRLQSEGFSGEVQHFQTHDELTEALLDRLKPGDAVLIKGSRSMKMETIWNKVIHGAVSYRKRS